jgi:hypothetical protein
MSFLCVSVPLWLFLLLLDRTPQHIGIVDVEDHAFFIGRNFTLIGQKSRKSIKLTQSSNVKATNQNSKLGRTNFRYLEIAGYLNKAKVIIQYPGFLLKGRNDVW